MAQIGNILREARIRRGLSLKDVSDITKVRAKYLEALEQDDYHVIPGPTFVKAYLRTYASFLRVDADALVEEYRSTYERRRTDDSDYYDQTLEQVRARSLGKRRKRSVRGTRRGYALIGALAVVAVVLLAWFGSNRGQTEATLQPESIGGLLTTTTVSSEATSSTQTGETGGSTTTSTEAVFTGNDVWLRIRATDDCFLIVRDDNEEGEELFRGTLLPGQEVNETDSKRYWVHIGLPDAVRVFIKDVEYNMEGEEGGFFIVTETGIERIQ